jgi:hypothetical protein
MLTQALQKKNGNTGLPKECLDFKHSRTKTDVAMLVLAVYSVNTISKDTSCARINAVLHGQ